jgi:hypothetical protein
LEGDAPRWRLVGHRSRGHDQKDHPEWVWSLQGDWYDRETGRVIAYFGDPVRPQLAYEFSWRNLHTEEPA